MPSVNSAHFRYFVIAPIGGCFRDCLYFFTLFMYGVSKYLETEALVYLIFLILEYFDGALVY